MTSLWFTERINSIFIYSPLLV